MEVPEPLEAPKMPLPPKREVPEPLVEAPKTKAEVGEPEPGLPEPPPEPKIEVPVPLEAPNMEVPLPVDVPPKKELPELAPVEPKMLLEAVLPPEGAPKRPEPEVAGLSKREDPEDDPKIDLPSSGFSVFSPKALPKIDPTDPLPVPGAPKIEPPEEAPKSETGALPPPSEAGVPKREPPELGVPKIDAPPEPPESGAVQRAPPEFGAGCRSALALDPKMDPAVPPNRPESKISSAPEPLILACSFSLIGIVLIA
ncbi:hypothetical protein AK812_SmicGene5159 [Symbiodinium microadriaticum]|uniref:Uncharacterized protein n=1 Tax=Symbiodinium microadriaticum TaxID=2951 RepID=A0A1Q9EUI6_SYMMI|nr:hypothetical protein AK812_SmicGene5159 [Symbiodinium microadriaticum]